MSERVAPSFAVGAALGYLMALGWAIENTAYDIWGALVIVPPMTLVTVRWARRLFRDSVELFAPMMLGFAARLAGCAARYCRILGAVRWTKRRPYAAMVVTVLFAGGLAYSSFANLGILARQKSLLMPFMLLPPCVPLFTRRHLWAHPSRSDIPESARQSRQAAGVR